MKNEPLSGWPLVGLVTLLAVTVLTGCAAHAFRQRSIRVADQVRASAAEARIASLEQQVACWRQDEDDLVMKAQTRQAAARTASNMMAGGASWR